MAEPLKESIFSREKVSEFSDLIKSIYNNFDEDFFLSNVFNENWKDYELKERMRHITIVLNNTLNLGYIETIKILDKVSENYSGFASLVLPDFVEVFGLDNFNISKRALKKYTSSGSSEFAVRPFILKYKDEMMEEMYKWSRDKNFHVRRLSTEGCRPRLPWAIALPEFKKNPEPIIPILEELKNDDSEYVRKSVANNLNDISKDNPKIALELAEKWIGKNKNTDWIVKHGLRTLLKKGNQRALELFDISKKIKIKVSELNVDNNEPQLNDKINFGFKLRNEENCKQNVRVEYKIDFKKSNGGHSAKIFKISETELNAGESRYFKRSFDLKNRTTRKLYPGEHKFTIVINGVEKNNFKINLEI